MATTRNKEPHPHRDNGKREGEVREVIKDLVRDNPPERPGQLSPQTPMDDTGE